MYQSYRKLADGTHFNVSNHSTLEDAIEEAMDSQRFANRGLIGYPYPYYVAGLNVAERRADTFEEE